MKSEVRQQLFVAGCAAALLTAGALASAQEVSVTPVYTAPAYAQPLKLDTDRYAAEQRAHERGQSRVQRGARNAAPTQHELQAVMRRLTPEYNRRLKRDGEASANAWVRQAAFELGQQAAQSRSGNR